MENNYEVKSLTDALKSGVSLDSIRESFEAALKDAENEVAKAKAKEVLKEAKSCGKNCGCKELSLDDLRERMIYDIMDYLIALGLIPKDANIEKEDIDYIIDAIKEIEKEYKAKADLMKIFTATMAGTDTDKRGKSYNKENTATTKPSSDAVADYIIKEFLKELL